jgi:single-strand DNA-binding protein
MQRGLNKVMIIGQLERDPEMRHTPNGRPVTSFSVATPHTWLSAEGVTHQETEWFNVVAWGELARQCHDRLGRGHSIYVEGRLKTRSWEDTAGKRHFRTEIVAKEIILLQDSESHSHFAASEEEYQHDENDF